MKYNKLITTSLCLFCISHLYAAKPVQITPVRTEIHPGGQFINHKDWNFVENKGQLPSSDIKFYGHQGGVYLYCKPGMMSFVFTKIENSESVSEATSHSVSDVGVQNLEPLHRKLPASARSSLSALNPSISASRTDLILINANASAQIIASDKQEYYENYYTTGDADHGITSVHTYKTITYKDIYPKIDMVLNCKEKGMEYSFIVHPGGKVSDIQLQWRGIEKIKRLKDFGIEYSFDLGYIEESAPKSFAEGKLVPSSFIKNGFKVGSYDKDKDLVIDPTLVWGTYFGGSGIAEGTSVATDLSGNVYITGFTGSNSGIATNGAHQTSYGGGSSGNILGDAYLAKFASNGNILWATYYGGRGDDVGYGVATDTSGNVYITGMTESLYGIATKGSYQSSLDGGQDAFLSKFSTNGTLIWATYYGRGSSYGSPGYTAGHGVATDGAGNVYITGETESDSIIATNGAYQTYLAGSENAFLAKFNTNGNIKWATYYGGEAIDYSKGIATDKSGNVYITGSATSTSGIATSGAYQTSLTSLYGTYPNAFLAKFDSSCNRKWATYYGNRDEVGNSAATDGYGNVYITGPTEGDSNIATSGAYQTSYGGSFLTKFSSNGSVSWATYFGGNTNESYCVCTDAPGNIYIAGYTDDKNGIATSSGYQSSIVGLNDAFLAKFDTYGAETWGTYFGGDLYSLTAGVCTDAFGNVYITGYTNNKSGIATFGAFQTAFGGGTYDAFLAKFNFLYNDAGIAAITSPDGSFCPGIQKVIVKLKNYGSGTLTKVGIGWSVNGKLQATYSWAGSLMPDSSILVSLDTFNFTSGVDTIKAWTSNPNGLKDSSPNNDSSSISLNIYSNPPDITGPIRTICKGTEISFGRTQPDSGTTYSWTSFPAGFTSTSSYIITIPDSNIIYILTETNSYGCSKTDSQKVIITPRPNAHWTMNYSGDSAIFHAIDSTYPSSDYSWIFGDSTTIKHGYVISHLFPKNKIYNVNLQVLAGCVSIFDSSLNVTKSDIKLEPEDYQLNLFPNPFSESTTLQCSLFNYSKVDIALFDITGRKIEITQNNTLPPGEYSFIINAEKYHLYPGVYLLKFMTDDGYVIRQIVKF